MLLVLAIALAAGIVIAFRRMHLDGLAFALLVYFAPPLIAALVTVHLLTRPAPPRSDRTAG